MFTLRLIIFLLITINLMAMPVPAGCMPLGVFTVSIDTQPFTGTDAYLTFDLVDNDPVANSVSILDFTHDGQLGAILTQGGPVTGSLPGSTTLEDTDYFNEILQFINLGTYINFTLALTEYTSGLMFPNQFSFFILDSLASAALFPTSDPTGANALFVIDINGNQPGSLQVFSSPDVLWDVKQQIPLPGSLLLLVLGGLILYRSIQTRCSLLVFMFILGLSAGVANTSALAQDQATTSVKDRVQVTFSGFRLNRTTQTFDTVASIKNISNATVTMPIHLVIKNIVPTSVTLYNGNGLSQDSYPLIAVITKAGLLLPGEAVNDVILQFTNPTRVRFAFDYDVLGGIGSPPVILSQAPPFVVENKTYHYAIKTYDYDPGDTPTYALEEKPAGMTIDANTGIIEWTPTHAQIGVHPILVKVQDHYGLFSYHAFTVAVQTDLGNLPALVIGKAVLDPLADPQKYETRLSYADGQIEAQHLVIVNDLLPLGFEINNKALGLNIDTKNLVTIKSPFFVDPSGTQFEYDVPRGQAQWVMFYYSRGPLEDEYGKPNRDSRPIAAFAWGTVRNVLKTSNGIVTMDLILDTALPAILGVSAQGVRMTYDLNTQTGTAEILH
ncbi:MAG: putative Ig domain-containing protein [Candidatus Competibacteraceae bacterium]